MVQGLTVATLLVLKKYIQIMTRTSRVPPIEPTNSKVWYNFDLLEEPLGEEEDGLEGLGLGVGTGGVVAWLDIDVRPTGDGIGEGEGEGEDEGEGWRNARPSDIDDSSL